MTTKTLRPLFLAAFTATLAFTAALRAAIPPAENLLPADTLFVLAAPDCTALRVAFLDSPQAMFWGDPAMRPFHDKFMGKLDETFVGPLEKDLGMKLADFADLPQGQFTFAVTQNGWDGIGDQMPGLILLLDAQDKGSLLATNLAALQKKWSDSGKPMHTETVRGIPFSVVTISSNDLPASLSDIFHRRQKVSEIGQTPKPEKPAELVIGQFDSLLIVGNSTAAVDPVVAHLTGGTVPALSGNAVFAADQPAQFRGAPLYYAWFNAKTFFSVISQMPEPQPNPNAPSFTPRISPAKTLTALGFMGLKSAGFAVRESHDGSEADFFFSVPEANRTGLLKMVAAASKDSSPPPFIPADAAKFWRWRVDGQKDWAALQSMLDNISPAAMMGVNATIMTINNKAQQTDPDFDLRKNLIGNLGDDLISYQKPATGNTIADLNKAPSLFVFAASNPDQAAVAIKIIASFVYGQQAVPEPRDFLGKKIYTITRPAPQFPGAPPATSLYLTTSGGYVAMSTDASIVEGFLRSAGNPVKPLSATAGLAEAAQHVGGMGNGLFGYENQRAIMRSAFTLVKNSAASNGGIDAMSALPEGLRDWMDFSLLPGYDQVSKYFFFSVFGGSVTPDSIAFKVFAPRPPGLN
jgi:hypothetical protein